MDITGTNLTVFIQVLKRQRFFVDYAVCMYIFIFLVVSMPTDYVGSACVVFVCISDPLNFSIFHPIFLQLYDHILTLHLEIRLIWRSPWSYTKVLFLLIRYMAFAATILITYGRSMPDLSTTSCKVAFRMAMWLLLCAVTLSQIILSVRTWVVWNMNRTVGIWLCVLLVIDAAGRFPVIYIFLKMMENAPPPYPGYRGCFFTKGTRIIWVNYAVTTALQTCFLALMAISAFRAYRWGSNNKLWNIIHKDGITFYIYLLGLMILNVVISFSAPADMVLMFSAMEDLMYMTLTARIVLRIRDAGNPRDVLPELHTGYEVPGSTLFLQSREREPQEFVMWASTERNIRGLDCNNTPAS